MCGIAGYVRLDGGKADIEVLRAMCDVIEHRGPDGEGLLVEGPYALGMRRLAIIDVAGGDQPIHTGDGRQSIVFNGECYDYAIHRAALEAKGHRFKTHSDTETVLHLYEEHGPEGMSKLRGMFAFAILDRPNQRVFFARDRIGKKPFHWYRDERFFLFGSEIKSILKGMSILGIPRPEPDLEAIVPYMGYGYVPDPLTAFKGISKLPPAHTLALEGGRVTTRCYWEPSYAPVEPRSEAAAAEELEALLEESVRLRMISEVPLGAYLSGGIDSSTVVGLMARVASGPVKTFSIGFQNRAFDELPYARTVAKHLGTEHHEFEVKPDAAAIIDDLVRSFDEPFADSSAIPTYYVSKMARSHVTVVLSGDGGDELFAGYSRYLKVDASKLASLPRPLRRGVFGTLARLLPDGMFGKSRLFALAQDEDERYVHAVTSTESEWHDRLFTRDFAARVKTTDPAPIFLDRLRFLASADATTRRMFADFMLYLPADIMTKVDRMSMAVSLEARAPLLDHKVVEFAARLPLSFKLRNGETKYLLRGLARRLVPPEVIDRRKQGFGVPVAQWFQNEWSKDVDDLVLGPTVESRRLFQRPTLERLVREHRSQRRDHSQLLWSLMMLELWHRRYVDDRAFA